MILWRIETFIETADQLITNIPDPKPIVDCRSPIIFAAV